MPNTHNNIPNIRLASLIILTLSFLAIGGTSFALPTTPTYSPPPSGYQTQNGYNNGSYFPGGTYLPGSGSSWGTTYDFHVDETSYDDGNSSPVPEPASALLMSLGLAGAAYLKRRRK